MLRAVYFVSLLQAALCLLGLSANAVGQQQFTDELVLGGFTSPVGVLFQDADTMYVWERRGLVHIVHQGVRLPTPLIDIRDEVGNWRDYGLLGFALDPNFAKNGRFYLAYVVDRHHLQFFGTPNYDPQANDYFSPTVVRVTRYEADPATNRRTVLPGSRFVLLGEGPGLGPPLIYNSHGACSILFGRDGTLLVAAGDGASFSGVDAGSHPDTTWEQGLIDGVISPATNVGAFRAQQIDDFGGKILRLDPATGNGLPSNPFYDPANPRSARSRVYALGLRNPCRMTLRPGTGSTDPSLGQPGVLYVGDVGFVTWEELNVVDAPGMNFGWPLFEGMEPHTGYQAALTANQFAPNPLFGGSCNIPFFRFQDLLKQAQLNHSPNFPNPCNTAQRIAASTPTFMHALPAIDWRHGQDRARVPVFLSSAPSFPDIGTPSSGVAGTPFRGNCSIAGTWHSGLTFPSAFGPCYYSADYGAGWIRRFEFDAGNRLTAVHQFAAVNSPMMLAEHPGDHSLVYVSYSAGEVRKIVFGIEPPPTAVAKANVLYGPSMLDVQLDGRSSFDPQGQPLTYLWTLPNGRRSTYPQLGFKFLGTGSPTVQNVTLTVSDPTGAHHSTVLPIGLDNTPPVVAITSVADGALYSLTSSTQLTLQASVTDREHALNQLTWSWQVTLAHNNHVHPEPASSLVSPTVTLSPTPRDGEFYGYRIDLKVTDPGGLSGSSTVWLYPNTTGGSTSIQLVSPAPAQRFLPGDPVTLSAVTTGAVQRVEFYSNGALVAIANSAPFTTTWVPTTEGRQSLVALAVAADGTSSSSNAAPFEVEPTRWTVARLAASADDANECLSVPSAPQLGARDVIFGDDGAPWQAGLRFADLPVPPGARVRSARIDFTASSSDAAPTVLSIACEAAKASEPIAARIQNLSARSCTAPLPWNPPAWTADASSADQQTPDLAALIAPMVASSKWTRSLLFRFQGTGLRRAYAHDGNATVAPLLTLGWLPPPPTPTTIQLVAGTDDAVENLATGNVTLNTTSLPLGTNAAAAQMVGLRFVLPLARGTRIHSARLRFAAASANANQAVLRLRVQSVDNAATFVASRYNIALRTWAPNFVLWSPPDWNVVGESGDGQRSADVTSLVQLTLDRAGWQAGNAIAFAITGTGERNARAFEAGAGSRPILELQFESGK